MATKYLEKFNRIIDKRQADQVLKLLNKKKQAGEIRTVQEFVEQLDTLIRELTQTELTPTLKLFEAKSDETIDSGTYNFMLERIEDDLIAGFEEATNINEVQKSHQAVIRDVVFKKMRQAIAELEAKSGMYEFMDNSSDGFGVSIFSTFREVGENRTTRSNAQTGTMSSIVFSDPRTGVFFETNDEDASIDLIGERLTLTNTKIEYDIKKVRQIFDSEAPRSELIVDPPSVKIENIIDGEGGTYWVQTSLFSSIKPYVKTKLEFELPGTVDINFIEIEPISLHGVVLESVEYVDGNNSVTTLLDPEQSLLTPVALMFEKTGTNKVILTFRNDNPDWIEFEYNSADNSLFDQTYMQPPETFAPELRSMMEDLKNILTSVQVKDVIGIFDSSKDTFSGYEFTIGLDNVRIGLSSYASKSIYISPFKNIEQIGQVGLTVSETRPVASSVNTSSSSTSTTYDTSDGNFFFSSIEYWVIKRDINVNEQVVQITRFPILPLNTTRLHHERLLLTKKSSGGQRINDVGSTMFFTDETVGTVKVHRNGYLLADTDWTDITTSTEKTPGNGDPMKFNIRIENPYVGDIYTVTYTPMTSTTRSVPVSLSAYTGSGIDVVDLKGDTSIRTLSSHIVAIDKAVTESDAVRSDIGLCVIIRNNSSRNALSSAVEEYRLVIGEKNSSRFEEI